MLTVLFDLDDTLINNNAEQFTKVYLGLLGKHLQEKIDSKLMIPALLEGTRQMVVKTNIAGTLEETFDKYFYPAIGLGKENLAETLDDFYSNTFPVLKPLTSPKPDMIAVVKACLEKGWQVAVATNPLFPIAAVHHRLKWAGLDSAEIPFAAITSFESYHFAKPQSAYFSEVAARVGAFDHPVVMIGNDLKDDIIPAGKAGFPVFWLTDSIDALPAGLPQGSRSGKIQDILPWLQEIEKSWQPGNPRTIPSILAALRGTAAAVDTLVRDLNQQQWDMVFSETDWNFTEIICHLRDVDRDVNLPRIHTILSESQPFIAGIETDLWAVERDYKHQNGFKALHDFLQARQEIVSCLEIAGDSTWQNGFRHTIFGPSTLRELFEFTISHDNNHIRQIMTLLTRIKS